MSIIRKAKKQEAYLKIGLSGPSGSGKTYSALLLAKGILGGDLSKAVIIDTENSSADLYSHLGEYNVLPFSPPFHPQRYSSAIKMCLDDKFPLIIIDSISHEWAGTGGCLEIHEKLGGKYQDWAEVTPMHNAFLDSILQAKAHVIVTMRKKQDYAMVEKGGRMAVEKMGLKEIQRDGFEYELTLSLDVNMDHNVLTSKNRTTLFTDGIPFRITEDTGKEIMNWNRGV